LSGAISSSSGKTAVPMAKNSMTVGVPAVAAFMDVDADHAFGLGGGGLELHPHRICCRGICERGRVDDEMQRSAPQESGR
jgi:hypothetical protein